MRRIVFICASAVLCIAPAWAQQAGSTDASHTPSPTAGHPTSAPHKSQSAIGQALAGLLNEARRSQSQRAAHDPAAGADAAARANGVDTPKNGEPAPTEVAIH